MDHVQGHGFTTARPQSAAPDCRVIFAKFQDNFFFVITSFTNQVMLYAVSNALSHKQLYLHACSQLWTKQSNNLHEYAEFEASLVA